MTLATSICFFTPLKPEFLNKMPSEILKHDGDADGLSAKSEAAE